MRKKNVSQLGMGRNLTTFLYSDAKKSENPFDEKTTIRNAKIKKRSQTYKHNVNILNFFNTKLQVKNNESEIKEKLKDL